MKLSDMLFANAMMGEGGGGGDLPFKTANVTLITTDYYVQLESNEEVYYQPQGVFYTPIYNSDDDTIVWGFFKSATATDTLQQSESILAYIGDSITLTPYGERVSESGDVTYDAETQTFTVFGDCTITLHSID